MLAESWLHDCRLGVLIWGAGAVELRGLAVSAPETTRSSPISRSSSPATSSTATSGCVEVEHLVVALWRAPGADLAAVRDTWADAALAIDNVQSCTISLAEAAQGRFAAGDPVDMLIALGLRKAHDLDDVPERDVLYRAAREVNVWRVDPHHEIVSEDPTSIKMVSFVARAEHLSHEQFVRHWTEVHAPLARRHHAGLADYTQNVVRRVVHAGRCRRRRDRRAPFPQPRRLRRPLLRLRRGTRRHSPGRAAVHRAAERAGRAHARGRTATSLIAAGVRSPRASR